MNILDKTFESIEITTQDITGFTEVAVYKKASLKEILHFDIGISNIKEVKLTDCLNEQSKAQSEKGVSEISLLQSKLEDLNTKYRESLKIHAKQVNTLVEIITEQRETHLKNHAG